MSPPDLHHSLLKPAILHILRGAGFYGTRPSVLDTLTDLCARHLLLIASRTAEQIYDRTTLSDDPTSSPPPNHFPLDEEYDYASASLLDTITPTLTDVRLALASTNFFSQTCTASEEAWRETTLRRPLSAFPEAGAREKERRRRDEEDTADVREFIDWVTGPVNAEIRRIAGLIPGEDEVALATGGAANDAIVVPAAGAGDGASMVNAATAAAASIAGSKLKAQTPPRPRSGADEQGPEPAKIRKDDYLTLLKKKHSKTGDEARYAGTALGSTQAMEERASVRPTTTTSIGPPAAKPSSTLPATTHASSTDNDDAKGSDIRIEGGPVGDTGAQTPATMAEWTRMVAAMRGQGLGLVSGAETDQERDWSGGAAVKRKASSLEG